MEKPKVHVEHKQDRERRIVLARHPFGLAGLRLEQYLETTSDPTLSDFLSKQSKEHPEAELSTVDTHIKRVMKGYQELKERVQYWTPYLFNALHVNEHDSPERLGRAFFQAMGPDAKPRSRVIFYRKGPAIVLACRKRRDLATLYHQDSTVAESSLEGFFSREMPIYLEDRSAVKLPVIVIFDDPKRNDAEVRAIVDHEWRHCIHSIINKFSFFEPSTKNNESQTAFRGIKDEIFSYFIDGDSAMIPELLRSDLYKTELPQPSETNKKELQPILVEIEKICATLIQILPTADHRTVIANELVDVPLSDLLKWLQAILQTYQRLHDHITNRMLPQVSDQKRLYSRSFQTEIDRLRNKIWADAFFRTDIEKGVQEVLERKKSEIEVFHTRAVQRLSLQYRFQYSHAISETQQMQVNRRLLQIVTRIEEVYMKRGQPLTDATVVEPLSLILKTEWPGITSIGSLTIREYGRVIPLLLRTAKGEQIEVELIFGQTV